MKPYYADDLVTLYHGDCLEITEWLSADVLVTDPPYGIGWRQPDLPGGVANRGERGSFHRHEGIRNDSTAEVRDSALAAWGDEKPGVVFAAWRVPVPESRQVLTWLKPPTTGVVGAKYGYRRDTEAVHLIGKHEQRPVSKSSVLVTKGSNTDYQDGTHPHMKPVSLIETLMEWCPPGVIADPFAGSGSTLIAAINQSRKAIGIELEERYCELIAKRIQNHTPPLFTETAFDPVETKIA